MNLIICIEIEFAQLSFFFFFFFFFSFVIEYDPNQAFLMKFVRIEIFFG